VSTAGALTAASEALAEQEQRYLMHTYARQPVLLVRGSGTVVVDAEGREHLDMVAGIAVNVLGHSSPVVRAALESQAATLVHTSNLYYTRPQLDAAQLLVASAFAGRVFFCNSGAEANECAIKIARKWGRLHRDGAHRIVCAQGAFHGRTLATLAATGQARYLEPFAPTVDGFTHVAFDDADAVAAALDVDHVAVLVEPIQGESGIHVMGDGTLRRIRELCDERDALLILDEVQSGMGRSGRFWAHQHAGITPDVMTVAKGLGGGVPIGAVLAAPRADVLEPGDHGCTFGGSPLAAAVAAAVLRSVLEDDLPEAAARRGEQLREALLGLRDDGLPIIEVRGRGLMLAVVLDGDLAQQAARAGLHHGVIVNPIGTRVLRLVPPLTITAGEVDEAVRRLGLALRDAATEAAPPPAP